MTQLQVIARYTVTFGNELEVESLLTQLADATRAEPGNLSFATYRQLDDERELVLLERYASLDAFTAHRATSHYNDLVLGQIVPRLDSRVVETFVVDEASQLFPDTAGAGAGAATAAPLVRVPLILARRRSSTPGLVVRENTESQTYDALVGDEIVGTLLYEREGPRLVLTHTAVQNRYPASGHRHHAHRRRVGRHPDQGQEGDHPVPPGGHLHRRAPRLRRPGRPRAPGKV